MDEEREMVLRMLKEGKISVQEADALLQELADQGNAARADETAPGPAPSDLREELRGVFKDLMESIPRDMLRQLHRTTQALRPTFGEVLRGLRGLVEGRAETTAEQAMAAGDTLELRSIWGDVQLTSAPGATARLRALKRVWSVSAEEAQRDAEALRVEMERRGTTVAVTVPRHQVDGRIRVDFEIALPPGVAARIDVVKGDLRVEGLGAGAEVRVARGDIRMRQVQGGVRVDVKSGDVALHDLAGTMDISTKSGDVVVADARAREVRVRTLSGDVSIDLVELQEGSVDAETLSGDITLALPPDARATVDASTRSGDVRSHLALRDQVDGFRSLRGVLNGPGAVVRLQATSGDVRIGARR